MTIMVIGFILLHQTKHIIIIYKHIYIYVCILMIIIICRMYPLSSIIKFDLNNIKLHTVFR